MWNGIRIFIYVLVLGLSWINCAVEGKDESEIELSKLNSITGEEELYNSEDGKYYKIVDKREETEKETLGFTIWVDRNEIVVPDCSDGVH